MVVAIILFPTARDMMIGTREFDEWMNLTVSNKHWLLFFALGTIGGCTGWIAYRILKNNLKRED